MDAQPIPQPAAEALGLERVIGPAPVATLLRAAAALPEIETRIVATGEGTELWRTRPGNANHTPLNDRLNN